MSLELAEPEAGEDSSLEPSRSVALRGCALGPLASRTERVDFCCCKALVCGACYSSLGELTRALVRALELSRLALRSPTALNVSPLALCA